MKFPPPGTIEVGPVEYIGTMPVRTELTVLPEPEGPSIAEAEWAKHGCLAVYLPNQGVLDGSWTMAEGGTVLVRAKRGGWYMIDLKRDAVGWHVVVEPWKRIPIQWSDSRACWVSTVLV